MIQIPAIDTSPLDPHAVAAIEAAEARAWADVYSAAPADWAAEVGLGFREVAGALVIQWAATGRRYFSRAIGLGVVEPEGYEDLLRERGLEPFDAQDRVVRDGSPLAIPVEPPTERELAVERVTAETADEWADFLQRVYRLDTGPWLQRLIGRPGWHEYVVRENGEVAGARGMFIGPGGAAWLGMDAPVPGVMTDDYELDAALCAYIVADGLARGATSFLTDIELPSPVLDTPAYGYFARLGFRRPYVRTHWTRV